MSNGTLERYGDDRHDARLKARSARIAKMAGLPPELANQPEAIHAVALELEARGFVVTPGTIRLAFHWIQDKADYSTRFEQALARANGWTLRTVGEPTRDLAVVRATKPGEEPVERRFTLEQAIDSHRLDAWVEHWPERRPNERQRPPIKYVVRINGEPGTWYGETRGPLPEKLPQWVAQALEDPARIKVFDAWWNYRIDMMLKSAMRRAVGDAIPDILLGAAGDHDLELDPAPRPPADLPDDDEVVDGEIVDDEPVPDHVHDDAPESRGYAPDDPGRPFT